MSFRWPYALTLLAALASLALLVRLDARLTWWPHGKQFVAPILIAIIVLLLLAAAITALLNRLLGIVRFGNAARGRDLWLIGYVYVFTIGAFGTLFLASQIVLDRQAFRVSGQISEIDLVDAFYLSGVTIATVGYGDITPASWVTKILVIVESLVGLATMGIFAGFFIGSLLSRQQQDRQARWFGGLQRKYLEALNKYPDAIRSMEEFSQEDYVKLQQDLLDTIATLVKIQYEPAPSAKVTANWMQLYTGADAPGAAIAMARNYTDPILRTDERMRTLWGVLVMREWNDRPPGMPGNDEFALPVYDPDDPDQRRRLLTGAPEALANPEGCVVVSDTAGISLSNQDESVRQNLREYFENRATQVRSFASVRMELRGKTLGVINIQSDEPELCGATPEVHRIVVDMVRPFARYLAQAVVNWSKIRGGGGRV